jgi:hypothetical protein
MDRASGERRTRVRDDDFIKRLTPITPDREPSYRALPDGRWRVHGKVYPVEKPPLGKPPGDPPEEKGP